MSDSRFRPWGEFAQTAKAAVMVLLGATVLVNSRRYAPVCRVGLWFLPFMVWALGRVVASPVLFTSLQKAISFALLYMSVPVVVGYLWREKRDEFVGMLISIPVLVALVGFVLRVVAPDIAFLAGRYRGFLGNPNALGLFSAIALMLSVVLWSWRRQALQTKEWIVVWILLGAGVVLSGSRNAMTITAVFLISYGLARVSPYLSVAFVALMLAFHDRLLLAVVSLIEQLGYAEFFRLETLQEASGRLIAWKFAWQHLNSSLQLLAAGRGFGYDEWLFHKHEKELAMLGHQGNVHSSWLSLWLNTGAVGVVLYCVPLLLLFWRGSVRSPALLAMFLTVIFSATFESWLMASLNPFVIQMLMVLSIANCEDNEGAVALR